MSLVSPFFLEHGVHEVCILFHFMLIIVLLTVFYSFTTRPCQERYCFWALHPQCSRKVLFLGSPSTVFVCSFIRSSICPDIYLMNGLSNLDETYRELI